MEYVYAALMLNETGAEINEVNLTNVLEAAGVDAQESRVKALIAALEDVDINEAVEQASVPAGGAAPPAGGAAAGGGGGAQGGQPQDVEEPDEELPDTTDDDGDDDDDDASGEGLGELFG